jgi:hypothetical protein
MMVRVPAVLLALLATTAFAQRPERTLDAMESTLPWSVVKSDGLTAAISPVPGATGKALRLDVNYNGRAGYAVAGRDLPLTFPDNYEISFRLKGTGPANQLQVKLVDQSGDNVWWWVRPARPFTTEFETIRIKKRQIQFAWGPTPDKTLRRTARIEFVLNADKGGEGSFTIDELTIRPLPPENTPFPAPKVSATSGAAPAAALDGKLETPWRSTGRGAQALTLDFGRPREFGGLILRWAEGAHATVYDVELSDDGRAWRTSRSVTEGNGGSDPLMMTESEARYLRLRLKGGPGPAYALNELEVKDLAFGANANSFISALANESPRGTFPRGYSEQPYWTLVGVDGGANSGLMGEDGAVEIGKGGPSVEPFVMDGYHVTSWADARVVQSLKAGYLPIPRVRWDQQDWWLETTSFAHGDAAAAQLVTRYTLTNTSAQRRKLKLVLAVRPFQVNGPRQFLNTVGGHSPITSLRWDGTMLQVGEATRITPLAPPHGVALSSFDAGYAPERLVAKAAVGPRALQDSTGMASGALIYEMDLAPGASQSVAITAPLIGDPTKPLDIAKAEAATAASWEEKLTRFAIDTPDAGDDLVDTAKASLAHILMSREGPSLRPGTRSYARSWIRDGAMIAESLLRLGHDEIPAEYLRWYAPYQFDNGKIPCCVDARGSDPTPENDSHGEFAFLAAEVWRYGRDRALAQAMWPHVDKALAYQESQRQSERTPANLTPARRAYYGLMPPSISHEGYSDKAAYSYWDDFWALEGFQSGVAMARDLDLTERATFWEGREREFRSDIVASVEAATRLHNIDFVPGAADRGDFDATSTTVGLAPGDGAADLPPVLLRNTFERQWQRFLDRRDRGVLWNDYTPYEVRNVGAFIRLGWRDRANELMRFYMDDRRPAAWNGWAEVVGRLPREIRFIGDMPHAWISSDYIRSMLDMFYYERDADRALVLAAGVPREWLATEGVAVRDVRTPYGKLAYSLRPRRDTLVLTLSGEARPDGGFVLPWPLEGAPGSAHIDGHPARFESGELKIPAGARDVVLRRP